VAQDHPARLCSLLSSLKEVWLCPFAFQEEPLACGTPSPVPRLVEAVLEGWLSEAGPVWFAR